MSSRTDGGYKSMHGLRSEPQQYPGVVLSSHVLVLKGHHDRAEAFVAPDQVDVLLQTR